MGRPKKLRTGPVSAKHVFLDIVGFSKGRSTESQTSILDILNQIVLDSIRHNGIAAKNVLLRPSGDGMCVVLLDVDSPYDIHIQIALEILRELHLHNSKTADQRLRFDVRIGINENIDNLVIDVNGDQNIAGAGINDAQRIMGIADGRQIVIGDSVYHVLRHREKYMTAFKSYVAPVKHGVDLVVHQFIASDRPFLDVQVPAFFRIAIPAEVGGQRVTSFGLPAAKLRELGPIIRVKIGRSNEAPNVRNAAPLEVTALIDTGSSATVINPEIATSCGLTQTGRVAIATMGSFMYIPEYIGAIDFPGSPLGILDPVRLVASSISGQPVSCLLGRDVLERWRLTYDGASGEVQIEEATLR